jgi:hypothetical protein
MPFQHQYIDPTLGESVPGISRAANNRFTSEVETGVHQHCRRMVCKRPVQKNWGQPLTFDKSEFLVYLVCLVSLVSFVRLER